MATTLRQLQDFYKQNNLGKFQLMRDGNTTYIQAPGAGGSLGAVVRNPNLSELDSSYYEDVGNLNWNDAGGISHTRADGTWQRAMQLGEGNPNYFDSVYNTINSGITMKNEEQRARDSNAAIARGDTAEVERLNPGYTLWNGAFVQKDQVAKLQSSGATVTNGQVNAQPLQWATPPAGMPRGDVAIKLAQAQPPADAGKVYQLGTPQIPTTTPTTGNVSNASAGTSSMGTFLDTLAKQNADNEKARLAQEQARQAESKSALSQLMGSITSPSTARTNAQNETGVNPANYFAEEKAKIDEIGVLTEEYNAVKAQKDAQLAATQDKLGSMNFINNQTAQIERNAAPKLNQLSANINSKAAVLQALQGRFNEAQDYVNQAVQDATADTKYKMDLFTTFYNVNQDSIDRLDKIYQDAFKTSMTLATTAYEQEVKSKTEIGNLMIKNPQAGITINDTLNQAYAKIGVNPTTSSQIIGSADTGYTNVVTDASGRVISSTPVKGGTGGGSNTSVTTYAQAYLDGQVELVNVPQNVRAEVIAKANEIAKAALASKQTTTTPSQPVTAYSAGQSVNSGVKPVYNAFKPENLYQGVKDVSGTVGNFFSGLFGF